MWRLNKLTCTPKNNKNQAINLDIKLGKDDDDQGISSFIFLVTLYYVDEKGKTCRPERECGQERRRFVRAIKGKVFFAETHSQCIKEFRDGNCSLSVLLFPHMYTHTQKNF